MSDNEIPDYWTSCRIGEVANVVSGGTPPSKDPTNFTNTGGIPWLTPADLSGYKQMYISRGARNLTEKGLASCSVRLINAGSVLFSSRAPIGYVAIAANDLTTNQGFKSFELPQEIESRFVYYYLRHIKPLAESMASGTTFKELSGSTASSLPLLIAPFNEQKRIADKLDALLARVDACRGRLDRLPAVIKRFRQAILDAAISGELTAEWRGAIHNDAWQQTDIQSLSFVSTGSTPLRSNPSFYARTGTPWITSAATHQTFITEAQEFVTDEAISAHRLKLFPGGTLLVAMYGEGKARGQVSELKIAATINQACAAIIVDEKKAIPAYVKLALQANYLEMRQLAEGGAQPNLNLSKIKEFPISLPTFAEQAEIVRRVETLFVFADRLEFRLQTARTAAERVTPTLLSKAFRGELVLQDPNDEPASVLLERLLNARLDASKTQPRKIDTNRKPMTTKITPESVRETIYRLPRDRFIFDDLRRILPGDYDAIKDAFFALLSEAEPYVQQKFDERAREIYFMRMEHKAST